MASHYAAVGAPYGTYFSQSSATSCAEYNLKNIAKLDYGVKYQLFASAFVASTNGDNIYLKVGSAGTYTSYTLTVASSGYAWNTFTASSTVAYVTRNDTFWICVKEPNLLIDRFALPVYPSAPSSDVDAAKYLVDNYPTIAATCSAYDGYCDYRTGCSGSGTCGSCPFGYSQQNSGKTQLQSWNDNLMTDGCKPSFPFGSYFSNTNHATMASTEPTLVWPTGSYAVDFWVKMDMGLSTSITYNVLYYDSVSTDLANDFKVTYRHDSATGLQIRIANVLYTTTTLLNLGSWQHIAVFRDISSGAVTIYLNSNLIFTGTGNKVAAKSPGTLQIGTPLSSSGNIENSMDQLTVWSTLPSTSTLFTRAGAYSTTCDSTNIMYFWSWDSDTSSSSYSKCDCSWCGGSTFIEYSQSDAQLSALKNFYYATNGPAWKCLSNCAWTFGTGATPCSGSLSTWFGIDCEGGSVVSINLAFNNLVGHFPEMDGNIFFYGLPKLTYLFIQNNSMTGSIPPDIASTAPVLTHLYLWGNQMVGDLSPLATMSSLVRVYLQGNNITGTIPTTLLAQPNLAYLNLNQNNLTGTLSGITSVSTSLLEFKTSNNGLTGTLPTSLMLSSIRTMDLSNNHLSGAIPNRHGTVDTSIDSWSFANNQLGCFLPSFMLNSSLVFTVDVTGDSFTCPLTNLSPNVKGAVCTEITLASATPNPVVVPAKNTLITLTGSNIPVQCSDLLSVLIDDGFTNQHIVPQSVDSSHISFYLTQNRTAYGTVRIERRADRVYVSNSLQLTFYKACQCKPPFPNNCTSPISGVCICNGSFTGDDCSLRVCPGGCGVGKCNTTSGICICPKGYKLPYCSATLTCPNNCTNTKQGICNTYTGECVCQPKFFGKDCSLRACPPYSEPYCSGYPHGICNNQTGNCTCLAPYIDPAAGCQYSAKTCPNNCNNHGTCNPSTGVCTCSKINGIQYNGTDCSDVICVPACQHGTCNKANGTCLCKTNYTGVACDVVSYQCPTQCLSNSSVCNTTSGKCLCKSGYTGTYCNLLLCYGSPECSGVGTCDRTGTSRNCICNVIYNQYGRKVEWYDGAACTIHKYACPGNCTADNKTCTECMGRGSCNSGTGVCLCSYPYTGSMCQLLQCSRDCSGHGTCNQKTGVCACDVAWNQLADCSKYSVPCTGNCNSTKGGYCSNGQCVCYSLWQNFPADVDQNYYCTSKICSGTPQCGGHGTCSKNGTCICDQYWTGAICLNPNHTCPNNCNKKGNCNLATGVCTCAGLGYGDSCEFTACLNDCSGHGTCNTTTGVCTCTQFWTGSSCNVNPCANYSYCHRPAGTCNKTLGVCQCATGYNGSSCELQDCVGGCNGHGTCNHTSGKCICDSTRLGDNCQKIRCSNDCSSHGACNYTTGICVCTDPWEQPSCAIRPCTNNCNGHGTCNTATGKCTCGSLYQGPNDPYCANLYIKCSDMTCSGKGYCDTKKGTCMCYVGYSGDLCNLGVCSPACATHGMCNQAFDPLQRKCVCFDDFIGPTCATPNKTCQYQCSGRGTCNKATGTCTCKSPYAAPYCQYASCPLDCSSHGKCDTTTGKCDCYQYYSGNGCQYVQKPCNSSCSGHGSCNYQTGTCVCDSNYFGYDCSLEQCPGLTPCTDHGVCNYTDGTCHCFANYTGEACEMPDFPCPEECNGDSHGFCDSTTGTCYCLYPYYGYHCGWRYCANNCTPPHGLCNKATGVCECYDRYLMEDCYFMSCINNCSSNGDCIEWDGTCQCYDGWEGDDCADKTCPQDCSGKGNCNHKKGTCSCKVGYTGDSCDKQNWWIIVVCAGGGSLFLIVTTIVVFLIIRQVHIHHLKKLRKQRMQAYAAAAGALDVPVIDG
eukprot:TRINITY_DN3159_c2_g1_i3.p1 TRINITY_DN3159_c2_g1~~TRINITY_DN3159_c2_g1_i3.p1  ORF type:complete len:2114 (-),score=400.25 TRINITY_DN3159_c2_g1_i3:161-5704(-)